MNQTSNAGEARMAAIVAAARISWIKFMSFSPDGAEAPFGFKTAATLRMF